MERARVREKRAKFSTEEAAAATQRNPENRMRRIKLDEVVLLVTGGQGHFWKISERKQLFSCPEQLYKSSCPSVGHLFEIGI